MEYINCLSEKNMETVCENNLQIENIYANFESESDKNKIYEIYSVHPKEKERKTVRNVNEHENKKAKDDNV